MHRLCCHQRPPRPNSKGFSQDQVGLFATGVCGGVLNRRIQWSLALKVAAQQTVRFAGAAGGAMTSKW